MKMIPLTTGEVAYVDDEDYALISRWKWGSHGQKDGPLYARTTTDPRYRMHRIILGPGADGKDIDHRDHNGLNNQRANLRAVDKAENQQNRLGARKDSRSGVRGVYWLKRYQRWQTYAWKGGKRFYFGQYPDLETARLAVIAGRARLMTHSDGR